MMIEKYIPGDMYHVGIVADGRIATGTVLARVML